MSDCLIVKFTKGSVVVTEIAQMITELSGRRHCKNQTTFLSTSTHFSNFYESPPSVLLDIKVESLRLNLKSFGGKLFFRIPFVTTCKFFAKKKRLRS